jgi:hypothetical protein
VQSFSDWSYNYSRVNFLPVHNENNDSIAPNNVCFSKCSVEPVARHQFLGLKLYTWSFSCKLRCYENMSPVLGPTMLLRQCYNSSFALRADKGNLLNRLFSKSWQFVVGRVPRFPESFITIRAFVWPVDRAQKSLRTHTHTHTHKQQELFFSSKLN